MALGLVIFRADATPEIGAGHIMRCLALAEALRDSGGNVAFITAEIPPALEDRLRSESVEILRISAASGSAADADETVRKARDGKAEWIVADGYRFGSHYQKLLRESGVPFLFIDDCGNLGDYSAQIVLNQNSYATPALYDGIAPRSRLFLGTRFALIRREFLRSAGPFHREIPATGRKVLVTMGGSDPGNLTLAIIHLLQHVGIRDLEVVVIAGGINPYFSLLCDATRNRPGFSVLQNVETMPELMSWADLVISAGGSTSWELAYMGVPSILCPVAGNQQRLVEDLSARGFVMTLTPEDLRDPVVSSKMIAGILNSPSTRARLSQNMRNLVDGNGSDRIVSAMHPEPLRLRRARMSDCHKVWEWITDPLVRANSFNPDPIPYGKHRDWYAAAAVSPETVYYIALDEQGEPLGQARIYTGSGEAVISVLIDREHRGHGVSKNLIRNATAEFKRETGIESVHAYIKLENTISKKAFVNAGYRDYGISVVNMVQACHLIG